MTTLIRLGCIVAAFVILISGSQQQVKADFIVVAEGADSFDDENFFQVIAGNDLFGSIVQVEIDLQANLGTSVWDPDQGPPAGHGGYGFKSGVGITAADMVFTPAPGPPVIASTPVLTIDFLPQKFRAGDSFFFDYDVDLFTLNGDQFAFNQVEVTVTYGTGEVKSAIFIESGAGFRSEATIENPAVPEPSALAFLTLLTLGAIVFNRRR